MSFCLYTNFERVRKKWKKCKKSSHSYFILLSLLKSCNFLINATFILVLNLKSNFINNTRLYIYFVLVIHKFLLFHRKTNPEKISRASR